MKLQTTASCFLVAALTAACGTAVDTSATVSPVSVLPLPIVASVTTPVEPGIMNIANESKLVACDAKLEDRIVYIKSLKEFRMCNEGQWLAVEINIPAGKDGKDGVNGTAGVQGAIGAVGIAGIQGTQGVTGAAGSLAATVVSTVIHRILVPYTNLNSVTVSMYQAPSYAANFGIDLAVSTMSDGKRCVTGTTKAAMLTGTMQHFDALIPETCGAGNLRVTFAWHQQHGHSMTVKTDGTFSFRAGNWSDISAQQWTAEFGPIATVIYPNPAP